MYIRGMECTHTPSFTNKMDVCAETASHPSPSFYRGQCQHGGKNMETNAQLIGNINQEMLSLRKTWMK